jgi:transcriptional regulator with XRE-family HTH domain
MQQRRPLDHDPVRVRRRRIAAGLEAQELAKRIGITKSAMSKIERGHNNASPGVLDRMAAVLGCNITDLMPATQGETAAGEETDAQSATSTPADGDVRSVRHQQRAEPPQVPQLRG